MSQTNVVDPLKDANFYLFIIGFKADGSEYRINLGPWLTIEHAIQFSDWLTDSRVGEQLLNKLGVTELHAYEA